ncbi:MAG: hypothetical protein LF885_04490 [Rickettsia endosymbiont of Culicoides impunctatus]|uniref:hypothetical protein n=1 Tax=unclassified Candidatus Tisiphia TaxID=2996318 RepID=UPI001E79A2B9|nr:MAG: hypothetical protein LF885_04490 [Rickettsia endosymbiont of Culicoides impunctatus]
MTAPNIPRILKIVEKIEDLEAIEAVKELQAVEAVEESQAAEAVEELETAEELQVVEATEPTIVVTNSTFGESLTARAGGHTITLTGHDFYIPFLSLAPNGRLEFNYDGEDYSIDVLGNMDITLL